MMRPIKVSELSQVRSKISLTSSYVMSLKAKTKIVPKEV